jgi:DNA polymerase-3 subunit alpha
MSNFVHLRVNSDRSLTNSMVSVGKLLDAAESQGSSAIALSDHMNMFGMISFYQKALSKGIKPLSSAEIRISTEDGYAVMTLIAVDKDGYKNLMSMISAAYEDGFVDNKSKVPQLTREIIETYSSGLIALSGARHGPVGKALMENDDQKARDEVSWLSKAFGRDNIFIELQRTGLQKDEDHVHLAVKLARGLGLPVVATNPVQFLSPSDYKVHEIRAAISESITVSEYRRLYGDRYTPHMYLKTAEEMTDLFDDIPSAIDNTVEIARRCTVDLEFGKNYLPQFPVPEGQTEANYLKNESEVGLNKRLEFEFGDQADRVRAEYDKRLDYELNIINGMGFPGYFLIVSDFIRWSKEKDIPVGPGRGSGAGSLVAYSLGITDLNPLKYDLLFERFLNPERVSMPDFDVDFCMDRRDEVIEYVAETYGHSSVSQIVTFGTLAAKMVVKDVARALGYPYRVGEKVSRLIPNAPGTKLAEALEEDMAFKAIYQEDSQVREIVDYGLQLEGLARQTGKHAGGVLIAPGKLTDYTPTYNDADGGGFVSQYNMNDVETAGLVKFDFLGLRTLTIIQNAINAVNARADQEDPLNILGIPLDDESVIGMLKEGNTSAVFQLESPGMKGLLRRLRPDSFEDLIALVALYRPGPLQSGMVDNFINRKHGREEISYPDATYQHELLKPILEPTYGIILYQEQVMKIAQELAGYSLGEADLLRRAMGKKKAEEMASQRDFFAAGAKSKGVDPDLAMKIFDLVEKFAGYGFNKSHSAAYALISYQTGWLKQHYPAEFMASVMSSDMDKTEKVVGFIDEGRRMGIPIIPPNINYSDRHFRALENGSIVYGLGAIKGVGGQALIKITEERESNGKYKSFFDFVKRVNPNKRVLVALIRSGAFPEDEFGFSRATLMANYEITQQVAREITKGKKNVKALGDMFAQDQSEMEVSDIDGFVEKAEFQELERLMGERETLGLFLTGHPMISVRKEMPKISEKTLSEITHSPSDRSEDQTAENNGPTTIAGVVMDFEVRQDTRGQTAIVKFDDGTGQIDVRIYNQYFGEIQHLLKKDAILRFEGKLVTNKKNGNQYFVGINASSLKMVRDATFSGVAVDIDPSLMDSSLKKQIQDIIDDQPDGHGQVYLRVKAGNDSHLVTIGNRPVDITEDLLHKLKSIFMNSNVSFVERQQSGSNGTVSKEKKMLRADLLEEGRLTKESRMAERARLFSQLRTALSS